MYIDISNQVQLDHLFMKEQQELQMLAKGPLGKTVIMISVL